MAKNTTPQEETVTFSIPLSDNDKDPDETFIGLNGKNYIIKHGESVTVPKPVYDIYTDSVKAKLERREQLRKVKNRMPKEE